MPEKTMLKQAFTLTAGNILSRFLGLIYVFPFAWLVGPEGQALFSYAYVPYVIFIDLATLGIPLGISKLISTYNAQDDYHTSLKLYKKATSFMMGIGVIMFLAMFFLAKPIAYQILGGKEQLINKVEDVIFVIRIISTALLFIPSIALLRGFFQGFKQPYESAMSQIVEQLVRVVFILGASFLLIKVFHYSYTVAIFFSVFAATLAALVAYIMLHIHFKRTIVKIEPLLTLKAETIKPTRDLIKELIKYSLPIAMFGMVTSLYSLIDTLTFNAAYLAKGVQNSELIYGTYAFEINKLIMIPVAFGIGLGGSMLIYITEAYTKRHYKVIHQQVNNALQICLFIILPMITLMMVFSPAVYSLFYQTNNLYGPAILMSFAPLAILFSFHQIVSSTLQGINKQRFLILSLTLGIALKYLYNEPLMIRYGYSGAILATTIGLLTTLIFNWIALHDAVKVPHLYLVRRLLTILFLNGFIGVALYGTNILLHIEVDLNSRISCFIFLSLNSMIYLILYIGSSYILGLLDVIIGRKLEWKNIFQDFRKNFVDMV